LNFEPLSNDDKAPPLPGTPPPVMSNRGYTTPPQHQEHAIQVQCEMLSNNKNTFEPYHHLIKAQNLLCGRVVLCPMPEYLEKTIYMEKFGGKNMGLHEIYRGKLLETNNYVH
jgi:hypothetical protein